MRVLLSIKPEFALKIFNGSKRYEYRRAIFKNHEVSRVIVYASDPIRQIIGEFEIEDILHDELQVLWVKTNNHAGISEKRFFEYFTNKSKGYAIKVKAARMYDTPLPLNSFMVSSPPQSFMYLGEEESLRGGEAPFFIKKFPLSLDKERSQTRLGEGIKGERLPINLIMSGGAGNYTPKIGGVNGYKT